MASTAPSLDLPTLDNQSGILALYRTHRTGIRYLVLAGLLWLGWLARGLDWITAESGLGYWFGIVGGTMMLILLLYPLRKRIRALRWMGSTRAWFRTHMAFGLLGPSFILYHSNFHVGSFNSQVALYCMLAVAISGIFGRYVYARIHNGLYGRKLSLRALKQNLIESQQRHEGRNLFLPVLSDRLSQIDEQVIEPSSDLLSAISRAIIWPIKARWIAWSLKRDVRKEISSLSQESVTYRSHGKALNRAASTYITRHLRHVRRIAQFTGCERMFALWHIFHFPLFIMMVVSALFHVLAVHMY